MLSKLTLTGNTHMTTKAQFTELLKNHVLVVHFTKKDNTVRKLICTLQESAIEKVAVKGVRTRTVPEHQVCCLDVELNEFRSFTIDSVLNFSIL
jgi:hypothetical protein